METRTEITERIPHRIEKCHELTILSIERSWVEVCTEVSDAACEDAFSHKTAIFSKKSCSTYVIHSKYLQNWIEV